MKYTYALYSILYREIECKMNEQNSKASKNRQYITKNRRKQAKKCKKALTNRH